MTYAAGAALADPYLTTGAALADPYLTTGYDLVVFEFVFTGAANVAQFRHTMTSAVPVRMLTLWASLATVQAREVRRSDRARLGDRVAGCWRELHASHQQLGTVVDAERPLDEVVDAVIELANGR